MAFHFTDDRQKFNPVFSFVLIKCKLPRLPDLLILFFLCVEFLLLIIPVLRSIEFLMTFGFVFRHKNTSMYIHEGILCKTMDSYTSGLHPASPSDSSDSFLIRQAEVPLLIQIYFI